MLISKANSFITSLHSHELLVWMQIPGVLCLRHAIVFLCVRQETFQVLSQDFQVCVSDIAILQRSLMCPAQVKLGAYRHENGKLFVLFWNASSQKALINFSGKNFKFAMLHVHVCSTRKSIRSHFLWFRLFNHSIS